MNTQKYKMSNNGLFGEADRSIYEDKTQTGEDGKKVYKDTVSKSIIDFSKTHLNYNLCPHEQYKGWELKEIHEKIRGKKMPKNGVAWGSTVISLPKDYEGDARAFFESAYKNLKKLYKLKDEDIVSAYVHMDESTPHMHFYFIPVVHEEDRDRISWETVMPRKMYQSQHEKLQKMMTEELETEVNLLNGETLGIDMTKMDAKQRKASMKLLETEKKTEQENEALISVQLMKEQENETLQETKETNKALKQENSALRAENTAMKEGFSRFKEAVSEWIRSHDGIQRILRAAPFLSKLHRDKIEKRFEKTEERGIRAIMETAETATDFMKAVDILDRGKREFDIQKTAAKNDLDIDELLADDDFEL